MPESEKFIPFTMANPRPVIHIDREEIYTKLEARIHYLQSFLDFTSSTYIFLSLLREIQEESQN